VPDYYMEVVKLPNGTFGGDDFDRVVEERRHGIQFGSNYLFMDGHVDNRPPNQVAAQLNPWANVTTPDPAENGGGAANPAAGG
jgi:prepilin-type processing-associated H-X9-DG protein